MKGRVIHWQFSISRNPDAKKLLRPNKSIL